MKKYLLLLLFNPISILYAQNKIKIINIDFSTLRSKLLNSPKEEQLGIGKLKQSTNYVSLPLSDGTYSDFQIVEYSITPKGVNTDIRTFYGQKLEDNSIVCRISLSKNWLVATIYTKEGIVVIEKSKQSLNANEYNVYLQSQNEFECNAESSINTGGKLRDIGGILNYTNGAVLRTYRMAIIVTNEFYTEKGNNDALINAEVTAIINSLNGLYEKELAVRFTLVSPNNPASSNVFYKKTTDINTYNQNVDIIRVEMNTRYGVDNYDLGHCLHTFGGGVAYYGLCNNFYKGGGWSGSTTPSNILLMAHEVGHQFTAPHTFLGNGGACSDSNRSLSTAFEPGSGNTIMSYAGICANGQNITGGKVPYFHTNSLQNMITYIQSGMGNTCGTSTSTGNTPPVVVAGTAITIPKNTPFTLIGSGTDANGDALSYAWEQYDLPVANDVGALGSSTNGVGGYAAINSTTAPLFRSYQSSSPERVFPSLRRILDYANNPADTDGEGLPNVSRTMNFRLTTRDNRTVGGGTHCSSVVVTVDGTKGPLEVTLPNGSEIWAAGSTQTINWNVNSTNSLSANVDVYLSVDGGSTFPYLIIGNTPNDGSENYLLSTTIPNSNQARIKIVSNESLTSNFFDISNANFTINSSCFASNSLICSDAELSTQVGNANLNLGLLYTKTSKFISSSKVFNVSGVVNRMIVGYSDDTYTSCQSIFLANSILVKFKVGKSGLYSISSLYDNDNSFEPFSVFNSNTFDCSSFVGSNSYKAQNGGVYFYSDRSIELSACTTYYMLIFTFGSPSNISLQISGLGDVYEEITNSQDYNYTYIALISSSRLISAESSTSNFTTLADGNYEIYGVMYKNGVIVSDFIGKTIEQILTSNCMVLSDNKKTLKIFPNPCPANLILTNPTDNITSGTIIKTASITSGTITATNTISGAGTNATYKAKYIRLNAGFSAAKGSIFKAEIGGCN